MESKRVECKKSAIQKQGSFNLNLHLKEDQSLVFITEEIKKQITIKEKITQSHIAILLSHI